MNSNAFSAADMTAAAASGHRDGYQAGYADAVKAFEASNPAAAQEAEAWGVYAKSDEYPDPFLIPEYAGSRSVIRSRVMEKARSEGFIGDFDQRIAELGWWLEPLFRAAPVAAAPVEPDLDAYDPASGELAAQWLYRNGLEKLAAVVRGQLDIRGARIRELSARSTPAAPGIDLEPFRLLVEGCEAEFTGAETEELEPDDSKVSYPEDRCNITFGIIRNARKALDASPKGGITADAIRESFPLFDETGLDEKENCCESAMQHDRKRLHAMLQATSAEVGA